MPPLVGLLQDKYYGIRRDVAKALGATGDARAVLPLIDLLADPEDDVCISAVEALAQINNKTAVPALVKTLSHPSNYVRHMAGTALSEFGWSPSTNEEKVTFLIALERWQDLTRTGKPCNTAADRDHRGRTPGGPDRSRYRTESHGKTGYGCSSCIFQPG